MEFVEIASFSSRLEAETIGHALDAHDIPFMVQSPDIGMFGPGFMGATASGAALLVPEDCAARARELLACAVTPLADEPQAEDAEAMARDEDAARGHG